MASYGAKYPIIAKLTEDENAHTVTHSGGLQIGEVISVAASWNIANSPLYASNRIVESLRDITGGTLTVNTDKLIVAARALMFGHEIRKDTVGESEVDAMASMSEDVNPYLGFGFYGTDMVNGERVYSAAWFPKVQFSEPNVNAQTSTESPSWQTPTVEATIMADITGQRVDTAWSKNEDDIVAWLNEKAGIVAPDQEP